MSFYSPISKRSLAVLAIAVTLIAVLTAIAAPAGAASTSASKGQALVPVAAGIYPVASCARKDIVANFTGRGTVERRVAFFSVPVSSAKRVASLSAQFKRKFPSSTNVAVSKQLLGGQGPNSKRLVAGAYVIAGGVAGLGKLACTTSLVAAHRELDCFIPGGLEDLSRWVITIREWGKSIVEILEGIGDPSSFTGVPPCGPSPEEPEEPGSNDNNDPEGNPNNDFHDATER